MAKHKVRTNVRASEVQTLRDILGALTAREVADILNISRATLYNWLKWGIPETNRAGMRNYKIVLRHIEEHGAQSLMRGRINPVNLTVPQKEIALRCRAMNLKVKRYVRCTRRRVVGENFCVHHLRLYQGGAKVMTIDGEIAASKAAACQALPLPARCVAVGVGGFRCNYVGDLYGGLCERHLEQFRSEGEINVMLDGRVETWGTPELDNASVLRPMLMREGDAQTTDIKDA